MALQATGFHAVSSRPAGVNLPEIPEVKPGDWITVGDPTTGRDAVVCNVRGDELREHHGDLEVVYLDERNRAINENVRWVGDRWRFVHEGPSGGYADNYDRLRDCVRTLRARRYS
jgi:hypothetical protein